MRRIRPLLVAMIGAIALLGAVPAAGAQEVTPFTGQGTNPDGTCGSFESGDAPAGKQIWQFNLQPASGPATMSATFSDGTVVTNRPADESNPPGSQFKWFIETDLDASVVSASAMHGPPAQGQGNTQFTVSHCIEGEPDNGNGNGDNGNGKPDNGNGKPDNGEERPDGKPPEEKPPEGVPSAPEAKPAPSVRGVPTVTG